MKKNNWTIYTVLAIKPGTMDIPYKVFSSDNKEVAEEVARSLVSENGCRGVVVPLSRREFIKLGYMGPNSR